MGLRGMVGVFIACVLCVLDGLGVGVYFLAIRFAGILGLVRLA